ncbi:ParB/RepB/Spo0J family partition protein [Christensenellaceae bacterium OttesenSCG-928-L17]|nr:ParB/RepB/Spo0J family partition protein [Christensenellaceae bacterium OttesenSCG-928-L17]
MAKKPGGLGRGLDALLGDYDVLANDKNALQELNIEDIIPNPAQPRKTFDQNRLEELAGSLKQHGMVQPIVVRREKNHYTIITGERRYRAAKLAGLVSVPAVVREYEDAEILEIALIENIQRENLNPVEEAAAISFLMQQHDFTQEEVAARLSKSRPAVANALRLLSLPEGVKSLLRSGELSAGHGRALSALNDPATQERLAKQAVQSGCSVRAMEQIVKSVQGERVEKEPAKAKLKAQDADISAVEEALRERLATKVKIQGSKKRGKITIDYYSADALQDIYDAIMGE